MSRRAFNLVAGLVFCVVALPSLAENATQVPGYTIHHNALTTDSLSPQVAKAYSIQRSKNRGMLNVSVVKMTPGSTGHSVRAKIHATATNLTGQTRDIDLREVEDGGAIYYIGDFRVTDQETLNFDLEVAPNGDSKTYSARLSQQFFTQ
jgi:hypothetical protein